MKLVAGATTLVLAFHTADAGFKDMKKSYGKLIESIKKSGDKRNLLSNGGTFVEVNNYGCWCYFDDQVGNGKGEPVDLIDAECKNLHKGYECALADFPNCASTANGGKGGLIGHIDTSSTETPQPDKAPWIRKYIPASQELGDNDFNGDIDRACVFVNDVIGPYGKCGAVSCAVEENFIIQYGALTNHVNLNEAAFSHVITGKGNFDPDQSCKARDVYRDRTPRECCGAYPERYGFKSMSNNADTTLHQACCSPNQPPTVAQQTAANMFQPSVFGLFPDGQVFKTHTHKCCFDGSLALNANKC